MSSTYRPQVDEIYPTNANAGGVNVELLEKAVKLIDNRLETEASGNVTIHTVRPIAQTAGHILEDQTGLTALTFASLRECCVVKQHTAVILNPSVKEKVEVTIEHHFCIEGNDHKWRSEIV